MNDTGGTDSISHHIPEESPVSFTPGHARAKDGPVGDGQLGIFLEGLHDEESRRLFMKVAKVLRDPAQLRKIAAALETLEKTHEHEAHHGPSAAADDKDVRKNDPEPPAYKHSAYFHTDSARDLREGDTNHDGVLDENEKRALEEQRENCILPIPELEAAPAEARSLSPTESRAIIQAASKVVRAAELRAPVPTRSKPD